MLNLEFVCLLSEACAAVSNNCVETEPLNVGKKIKNPYMFDWIAVHVFMHFEISSQDDIEKDR